ncbi:hypothetical protein CLOSTMETH_00870 [[Clostridium] methylpentosum DSM 5476]|uniref:Uncharacterized protein n=1 Tax=[Clostridium] methylpentosum DSM 5476 TaxID=537013 RepID=C0EAL3_9FIRM|nr:hypothetical protein CLOSTMETH_00870 [[Clostridium] methylpentosum DSM 5476]
MLVVIKAAVVTTGSIGYLSGLSGAVCTLKTPQSKYQLFNRTTAFLPAGMRRRAECVSGGFMKPIGAFSGRTDEKGIREPVQIFFLCQLVVQLSLFQLALYLSRILLCISPFSDWVKQSLLFR